MSAGVALRMAVGLAVGVAVAAVVAVSVAVGPAGFVVPVAVGVSDGLLEPAAMTSFVACGDPDGPELLGGRSIGTTTPWKTRAVPRVR